VSSTTKTADPSRHPAYRWSGVARPVDPRYPTNKAVLVLVPAVLILAGVAALLGGVSLLDAGLAGLHAGLLAFLVWALTRELSPDDNPAAFLAVAIALAAWARVGPQSLALLAAALIAARLVNRSTGLPAKLGDSLLLTLGFALLTWSVSWTCGVVGALALLLDALAPSKLEARRRHLACAAVLAAVLAARVLVGIDALVLPAHLPVFASIAGLGVLAVALYPTPRSVGDIDQSPLVPARVRAGLALGLLTAALASLDGGLALQQVAALWGCVLAVALGLPVVWLRRFRSRAAG
jgi:hypothetical protein